MSVSISVNKQKRNLKGMSMISDKRTYKVWLIRPLLLVLAGFSLLLGDEIRWLAVGDLHNWYSSVGCEIEVGRTGATADQLDGFRYPAKYLDQDLQAAKGFWLGAKDYQDPLSGVTYPAKTVVAGPRKVSEASSWMPVEYKLIAKKSHPLVLVDGLIGTELEFLDKVDEIDPSIPADRMFYNKVQTSMGVEMERKIYAFTNPFHQNYFIHEYTLTNNGICDKDGAVKHNNTLKDFYAYWQMRTGFNREACSYGRNYLPQNATWGRNAVNDAMGINGTATYDPNDKMNPFRAIYSWGGKHSGVSGDNGIGGAWLAGDGHLMSVAFVGNLVLHADKAPGDATDDANQPATTTWISSDLPAVNYENDQFNTNLMRSQYERMAFGHANPNQAADLGYDWENLDPAAIAFADQWNVEYPGSAGGFSMSMGFGPYQLAPNQSINIVWAEAAAGLSRAESYRIGAQYKSGAIDVNTKDMLVYTGRDSLIKTFWNIYDNYKSGYAIPEPPEAPAEFIVASGGDRVVLSWKNNAESSPGFAGYKLYRARNDRYDSTYVVIADIKKGELEVDADGRNFYEDKQPQRGFDYYYYIISYDDGSNDPDGRILYSSKFYTLTSEPAFLRRMPGNALEDIRVVPNPYHIRAQNLQYGKDAASANRIMFLNLPPKCIIKIYTERGDLVKTLDHSDNSGDESWNSLTESRQTVVSGVYIAYFETPEGESIYKKFIIVR
jgi:hypothetical protein